MKKVKNIIKKFLPSFCPSVSLCLSVCLSPSVYLTGNTSFAFLARLGQKCFWCCYRALASMPFSVPLLC